MIIPQRAWEEYHAELAEFRQGAPGAATGRSGPAFAPEMYCAETHEKARREPKYNSRQYADSARPGGKITNLTATTSRNIRGYEHYAMRSERGSDARTRWVNVVANHVWGTPTSGVEKLAKLLG